MSPMLKLVGVPEMKCYKCGERRGLSKSLQIALIRVSNERDVLRTQIELGSKLEVIGGTTTYQRGR